MPRGPKGEKRPADVVRNAIKVAKIATGEETEEFASVQKETATAIARLGGLKGGKARATQLTPSQRSEIARKAATTRWAAKTK